MIKPIEKNVLFLANKAKARDLTIFGVIQDLKDTLKAHHHECVGMAANMISSLQPVIIVSLGLMDMIMVEPMILSKRKPYVTEEGCLSLTGKRKVTRYREIRVRYLDEKMVEHVQDFNGFTAQIIQHEIDHLGGIII